MRYRPDLDGLRSIAVLLVLVFHFELFNVGQAGFIGVDIFFVLSGFLISSISWKQLQDGKFRLLDFYVKRIRRLSPALIAVQFLVLMFAWFRLFPPEALPISWESIATQAYIINFYLWKNVDYFGIQAEHVPLLHCWSLAIEEQFYLIFPLILVAIHRFARSWFWHALALISLTSFGLNLLFVESNPWVTFYLLPTRAWELSLGALTSYFVSYFASAKPWLRHGAAAIGLGLIICALAIYTPSIPFPGTYALLPTLSAMLLILAGTGTGSWLSPLLCTSPMLYIGQISYSLYLVHWPIKVLGANYVSNYTYTHRWLFFFISIALSVVIYHFIEDPVRRKSLFPQTRHILAFYAASVVGIITLSTSSILTEGWRFRFPKETLTLVDYTKDKDFSRNKCEFIQDQGGQQQEVCRIGKEGAEPSWLTIGDSHAWALTEATSLALNQHGEAGYVMFARACLPLEEMGTKRCRSFMDSVYQFIDKHPKISNVLVISIWRQAIEGYEGPSGDFINGAKLLHIFDTQFQRTLVKLSDQKRKVYIWKALPALEGIVPLKMAAKRAFNPSIKLTQSLDEYRATFKFLDKAIKENHALIEGVVSPESLFCDDKICKFEKDGVPLFFDNNHPAFSASHHFANLFVRFLFEAPKTHELGLKYSDSQLN